MELEIRAGCGTDKKMGNQCSMWHGSKKWKMHRKLSGKRSLVWDNNVKNNNKGTV
jgi:hypothetical protein